MTGKVGLRHDAQTTGTLCIEWKLFSQLWCVPGEMTREEELILVWRVKEDMGADFERCPDEFVRDRLVGGVRCPFNPERRHVVHAAMHYSFKAAAMGRYWGLTHQTKAEIEAQYRDSVSATDLWVGDGPFTEGEED